MKNVIIMLGFSLLPLSLAANTQEYDIQEVEGQDINLNTDGASDSFVYGYPGAYSIYGVTSATCFYYPNLPECYDVSSYYPYYGYGYGYGLGYGYGRGYGYRHGHHHGHGRWGHRDRHHGGGWKHNNNFRGGNRGAIGGRGGRGGRHR